MFRIGEISKLGQVVGRPLKIHAAALWPVTLMGCSILYCLSHSLATNGAFSARYKPVPGFTIHCLNGNLLFALLRPGFAKDPRVQATLDWQAQAITDQGQTRFYRSGTAGPGFVCAVNMGQPCG